MEYTSVSVYTIFKGGEDYRVTPEGVAACAQYSRFRFQGFKEGEWGEERAGRREENSDDTGMTWIKIV